jgi:undecaprenyl-diphosphatase
VLSADDGAAPGWFALASLVAASRVYVRMHHTSDVVGGAVLGLVLAKFARRFLT